MIYDFAPSPDSAYKFSPTLDGAIYNASVTWNLFGRRYYLNVNDQAGNLILSVAMAGSSTQEYTTALNLLPGPGYTDTPKPRQTFGIKPVNLLAGYFAVSTLCYYPDSGQIVVNP